MSNPFVEQKRRLVVVLTIFVIFSVLTIFAYISRYPVGFVEQYGLAMVALVVGLGAALAHSWYKIKDMV